MLHVTAQIVLGVILTLTLAKTLLVADAVWQARGGEGIASRVSLLRSCESVESASLEANAAAGAAAVVSIGTRRITPLSNASRRSSGSLLGAGGGSRIVYNRFGCKGV